MPNAAEAGDGLHGVPLRGIYLTSQDRLAEGRSGPCSSTFRRSPPDHLPTGLAEKMIEEPGIPNDDAQLNASPHLFAGFTFIPDATL